MQNEVMRWNHSSVQSCKQSTVHFMHLKFNSRRLKQWWRPTFLLCFRLRVHVVFGEGRFEGATRVILWWNSAPFVLLDIFNICNISNDNGTSFRGSSFINCFVERGVFNCSPTVKELTLLHCFVWKYRKPGSIYLLETFMFRWTWYHPLILFFGVVKIGGPWTRSIFWWTRSMDRVHGGVHGPGVHVLYFPGSYLGFMANSSYGMAESVEDGVSPSFFEGFLTKLAHARNSRWVAVYSWVRPCPYLPKFLVGMGDGGRGCHLMYNVYLIGHSPLGLSRTNTMMNEFSNEHNKLKIPTGKRLTSWLFISREVELGATENNIS